MRRSRHYVIFYHTWVWGFTTGENLEISLFNLCSGQALFLWFASFSSTPRFTWPWRTWGIVKTSNMIKSGIPDSSDGNNIHVISIRTIRTVNDAVSISSYRSCLNSKNQTTTTKGKIIIVETKEIPKSSKDQIGGRVVRDKKKPGEPAEERLQSLHCSHCHGWHSY